MKVQFINTFLNLKINMKKLYLESIQNFTKKKNCLKYWSIYNL